jgi:putative flippase GtrA
MSSGTVRPELLRFILVGALNTLATTVLYWGLLAVGLSPASSFAAAFVSGIGLAWWMNGRFTFATRPQRASLALYPLVYLPSWAVGQWLLAGLIGLGLAAWLAGPLASLLVVPLSFGLNRLFFRGRRQGASSGAEVRQPPPVTPFSDADS